MSKKTLWLTMRKITSLFLSLLVIIGVFTPASDGRIYAAAANSAYSAYSTYSANSAKSAYLTYSAKSANSTYSTYSTPTYIDQGSIVNIRAVEALTGLGILKGYDDGYFRPDRNVNRAESAKIICYLLIGAEAADALPRTESSFDDVSAEHWANPFIEHCVQRGIIVGYGDGRFGPDDNVTASQFAKMLLMTAGYGAKSEFSGSEWERATIDLATSNGIEILSRTATSDYVAPATREHVAQYAYNTLTIPNIVIYDAASGKYIDTGINLIYSSFGVEPSNILIDDEDDTVFEEDTTGLADAIDPDIYSGEGYSQYYRDTIVNGYYYDHRGYMITESDYNDMLAKRNRIYSEVISRDMDDYDKALAIHDWICNNIEYNYDFYNNRDIWKPTKSDYIYEHQLAWAGLFLGTAVCAGYSDAYKFLLEGLDIECYYVAGDQHAWNIVNVGNAYFHVDTTWDDQSWGIRHNYFLISDSSNAKKGYQWDRGVYPSCPNDYAFPTVYVSANDASYGQAAVKAGGGVSTSSLSKVIKGAEVSLTARANSGYVFESWEVISGNVVIRDKNSNATVFTMPNNNVSIRAIFKPTSTYSITVSVNDAASGTAYASTSTAEFGKTVVLWASSKAGYEFDSWEVVSGDVVILDKNSTNTMFTMKDGNVSIRAHFKPAAAAIFTVTVDTNNALYGKAEANTTNAARGDEISLTAIANSGYEFVNWEVITAGVTISGANTSSAMYFTMPNTDLHIRANFRAVTQTPSPTPTPPPSQTPTPPPSQTPTPSPSPTQMPTPAPTATLAPTPMPTATTTTTPSPSPTPTPTGFTTPTPTPASTPTPTPEPTPTPTPAATPAPTPEPTPEPASALMSASTP